MGPGPGSAPPAPAADGRPAPGPAAEGPDRSVGRAPGGVPPGGPGLAEVPGTARAAGVPLAPLADGDDALSRPPAASGRPGPRRRARGATAGPALAAGILGGPGGSAS